jgi:uncharacterized protein YqhQ
MPQGEYLQYGGQAIIEGVMMRSPRYFSVACRAPNGQIVVETEALEKTWIGRQKWLKLPFLRGSLAILDALALGIKSMRFASDVQLNPEYQKPDEQEEVKPLGGSKRVQDIAIGATIITSLGLGLLIFNFTPNLIAEQFARVLGGESGDPRLSTVINYIAEFVKVIFFLGYIYAIGFMNEIREVFKYHGAEHKAINTLEAHESLTMENCLRQTRLHPRCGTSFAVVVLLVSMAFFPFVPRYPIEGLPLILNVAVRFGIELMILPLVAGAAYELIRIAGKFRTSGVINALFFPGLMTQYLSTREPEEPHVEVALVALRACVDAEENGLPNEEPHVGPDEAAEAAQIS